MTDDEAEYDTSKASSVKLAMSQLRGAMGVEDSSTNKRITSEQVIESAKRPRSLSKDVGESITLRPVTERVESNVEDDLRDMGIDERISTVLSERLNITHLFALQQSAIREISSQPYRDVCISAPTGSGKTLMYLIPLINNLACRRVVRLRCLILVPSRELTMQVLAVAQEFASGMGLFCQALYGEHSLQEEGRKLVRTSTSFLDKPKLVHESLVDILISTPGRLLDHVEKTTGFTLEHLEVLVVDEADKLLSQTYQDWLNRIYLACAASPFSHSPSLEDIHPIRTFRSNVSHTKMTARSYVQEEVPRLRRILCSATLTKNPQKLAALSLFRPVLVDARILAGDLLVGAGRLTSSLTELEYKVSTKSKPLVLLAILYRLLQESASDRVLVFASSVERADRISSLLSRALAPKYTSALLSSTLSQKERRESLENFQARKTRVLVASDLVARGIDIPNLEYVLSYDAPKHSTTYVHRAGRTGRAGTKGTSILLLRGDELKHFAAIKEKLGLKELSPIELPKDLVHAQKPVFEEWHQKAGSVLGSEA